MGPFVPPHIPSLRFPCITAGPCPTLEPGLSFPRILMNFGVVGKGGFGFGGLGAAWVLVFNLLVGDPWFAHHTSSGDIYRDVTIPATTKATGRDVPGSETASNPSQQPMENAACFSSPVFSQESPHSTLPQKNQRYMSKEQLRRGQCSSGLDDP